MCGDGVARPECPLTTTTTTTTTVVPTPTLRSTEPTTPTTLEGLVCHTPDGFLYTIRGTHSYTECPPPNNGVVAQEPVAPVTTPVAAVVAVPASQPATTLPVTGAGTDVLALIGVMAVMCGTLLVRKVRRI